MTTCFSDTVRNQIILNAFWFLFNICKLLLSFIGLRSTIPPFLLATLDEINIFAKDVIILKQRLTDH